jgi:DNA-binding NtrC family response regulator
MAPEILLVTSEIVSRRKIAEFLAAGGYSVSEAGCFETALRLLQTFRYDLIVSDFHLIDRSDGVDLLSCAERIQPGVISVLMGREGDLRRCKSASSAFICKPVPLPALRLKIGLLLIHRSRATDMPLVHFRK